MNLPMTRTSSITINRLMMPLSIFLAIGAGFAQDLVAVEATSTNTANNFLDNNFAFGRPISPARRKRLPGSQLKGGRGLLTIEELEEEFEAVSFGDLFFDRVLHESSMSYSMSYGFGDNFSMSFSYETAQADRTPSLEAPDEVTTPIVDDAPGPVAPPEAFNTFSCDDNGDVALDLSTTPASDATSVDIVYSYLFETIGDDPNTVSLIEAAVVGTMVSTLLDCSATSGGTGRALTSASSVSTTFSEVLSQVTCSSSTPGSSCYTIESAINFQLEDGPAPEEARIKALQAVKSAMDSGAYPVPSVTKISYLGPDVGDNNSDSTGAPITANPNSVSESPSSDQPDDSGMSNMTKVGIGLMSVGGVVLVAALMRRRSLRARRHTEHVRLKDDGSQDDSLLTVENSHDSPAGTPIRNGVAGGDFQRQVEHEIA